MQFFRKGAGVLRWQQTIQLSLPAELWQAVNELAELEQLNTHDLLISMVEAGVAERQFHFRFPELWDSLTSREQQVAAFACLGYANGEIASALNVTVNTIKTHIGRILRKFSVASKAELGRLLAHIDFDQWLCEVGLL